MLDFRYPDSNIYIYTVETGELKTILDRAFNQFNVKVPLEKVSLVRLSFPNLIDPATYPYFTLLMQSLGSMVLGLEAFMKLNPGNYLCVLCCNS